MCAWDGNFCATSQGIKNSLNHVFGGTYRHARKENRSPLAKSKKAAAGDNFGLGYIHQENGE
jgi:hypothetical protein